MVDEISYMDLEEHEHLYIGSIVYTKKNSNLVNMFKSTIESHLNKLNIQFNLTELKN